MIMYASDHHHHQMTTHNSTTSSNYTKNIFLKNALVSITKSAASNQTLVATKICALITRMLRNSNHTPKAQRKRMQIKYVEIEFETWMW